ncbi:unnamed protein product [Calicophoron daubneyi]|uniref:C2H2-type domain-containing protein n=1 Tax=Calicophoron daubneyi TaxID=300641 RepID=A0AAV2TFE6_CALDB
MLSSHCVLDAFQSSIQFSDLLTGAMCSTELLLAIATKSGSTNAEDLLLYTSNLLHHEALPKKTEAADTLNTLTAGLGLTHMQASDTANCSSESPASNSAIDLRKILTVTGTIAHTDSENERKKMKTSTEGLMGVESEDALDLTVKYKAEVSLPSVVESHTPPIKELRRRSVITGKSRKPRTNHSDGQAKSRTQMVSSKVKLRRCLNTRSLPTKYRRSRHIIETNLDLSTQSTLEPANIQSLPAAPVISPPGCSNEFVHEENTSTYPEDKSVHKKQGCSTCQIEFDEPVDFIRHIQQIHLGLKPKDYRVTTKSPYPARRQTRWREYILNPTPNRHTEWDGMPVCRQLIVKSDECP